MFEITRLKQESDSDSESGSENEFEGKFSDVVGTDWIPKSNYNDNQIEIQTEIKPQSSNPQTKTNDIKSPKKDLNKQDILAVLVSSINFVVLYNSFQDCPFNNEIECHQFIISNLIKQYLVRYIIMSFINALIICLSIFGHLNRVIGSITLALNIYFAVFFDRRVTITHYGGGFTAIYGILLFYFIILFFLLMVCRFIVKQSKILFLMIVFGTSFFVFWELKNQCKVWNRGLENKQILDIQPYCHVVAPQVCPLSVFQKILSFIPYQPDCKKHIGSRQGYQQYFQNIREETQFLAFQNTNNLTELQRLMEEYKDDLQYHIFNSTVEVQSVQDGFDKGYEVVLDLSEMKYNIEVRRDDDLVKQRRKNGLNYTNQLAKKIIMIYIDTLSRPQFHRMMPLTAKWIESRKSRENSENIEFFRYHSISSLTFHNFMSLKYDIYAKNIHQSGHNQILELPEFEVVKFPCQDTMYLKMMDKTLMKAISEKYPFTNFIDEAAYDSECMKKNKEFNDNRKYYRYQFDEGKNLFRKKSTDWLQDFKQAGFITGRSTDQCTSNFAQLHKPYFQYLYDQSADHEGMSFACDPHYQEPESMFGILTGPNSVLRRCLNRQDVHEYVLDYGTKFLEQYQEEDTFLSLEFIDAHEMSGGSVVSFLDSSLAGFLENARKYNLIDDTMIVFVSDHGNHMHFSMEVFQNQQFFSQRLLPLLIICAPYGQNGKENEKDELIKNLQANSQKLVDHTSTHYFFLTLIYGNQYQYFNQSLFNKNLIADYDSRYSFAGYTEKQWASSQAINICITADNQENQ